MLNNNNIIIIIIIIIIMYFIVWSKLPCSLIFCVSIKKK